MEIFIPYGHCAFSSKLGRLPGNHFLTFTEGLEQFPALGEKVLWEGAQDISIDIISEWHQTHYDTSCLPREITRAKQRGVKDWAETCPHFLNFHHWWYGYSWAVSEVYTGDARWDQQAKALGTDEPGAWDPAALILRAASWHTPRSKEYWKQQIWNTS